MPRLGGGTSSHSPPSRSHGGVSLSATAATAFLTRFFNPSNRHGRNIILGLILFFLLRNILRHDYRAEEKVYLRQSGMTEEQIERFIPKTAAERKQYAESKNNDFEKMKNDIAYLLSEVAELKAAASTHGGTPSRIHQEKDADAGSSTNKSRGDRDAPLSVMDAIHAEKRRQREEQLLKEHPNFKPSKRIKRRDSFESNNGVASTQR